MYGNNTQHTQAASDSAIFINQSNNNTVTNNTTTDPALPPPAAPVISGDTVNGLAPATVTLNGTAAANSTITVFDNSTQLGTTVANGSGAWTFTTKPLANGSQSFTATATDSVGHVSPLSSPLVVPLNVPVNLVANGNFETGDFTAWTLGGNYTSTIYGPEIFINTNSTGGGTHAAGMGSVGADGTLSQTIATTPGQTYTLSFWLRTETSGGNDFAAKWNGQNLLSLTNAAQSGYTEHTYTVTATGSTSTLQFSAANGPSAWDLDNISLTVSGASGTSPGAPIISSFSNDSGVAGDGLTNDSTLTLTGAAAANSTVKVFDGTTQVGTAIANGSGAWSLTTAALADGSHNFTATATNASGTSAASAALAVTIDTVAPNAPVEAGDSIVNGTQVQLTGTAEANSTLQVHDGTTLVGTATTNATGNWTVMTSPLSVGAHDLTATATDAAGNTSAVSLPLDPVIGGAAPTSVVGFSTVSENSKSHIVTINGTADAYSEIKVNDGTTSLGTVTTAADGTWSFKTPSAVSNTVHTFTAQEIDSTGHVVASSGSAILGSTRSNTLTSTPGNDYFVGNGSSDTFVFAANFGNDVIKDFGASGRSHDVVQFSKSVFDSFASVLAHATQVGQDVVISADASDSVTLKNTKLSSLDSHDFHFS